MNLSDFEASLAQPEPPAGMSLALLALWWDAKGDWHRAHTLCQEAASRLGDHVHAYLHRKEGDAQNAAYWYARSGQPVFQGPLNLEWKSLVGKILD